MVVREQIVKTGQKKNHKVEISVKGPAVKQGFKRAQQSCSA